MRFSRHFLTLMVATAAVVLLTMSTSAQRPRPELSPPDRGLPADFVAPPDIGGEPVDASHFEPEYHTTEEQVQGIGPDGQQRTYATRRRVPVVPQGYRSPTLQGTFRAERMYIAPNGNYIEFIGARILSLDPQSPMWALGVRVGDVITRLDGIEIWQGAYNRNGVWRLPELENHFGSTDVRYILHGQSRVRVGQIVLDTNDNDGDGGFSPLRP
ncbi:MAG: hypothetical protein JNM18_00080 [Planctomycetaceae bacterium]|nr:hypothetical protein [Planctomycetaceae bacterium]